MMMMTTRHPSSCINLTHIHTSHTNIIFRFILVIHHNRHAKAKDTRCLVGSVSSDVELDEEQKKKDEEENDDDEAAEYDTLIGGKTSSEDSDRGGTVAFAKGMDAAAG